MTYQELLEWAYRLQSHIDGSNNQELKDDVTFVIEELKNPDLLSHPSQGLNNIYHRIRAIIKSREIRESDRSYLKRTPGEVYEELERGKKKRQELEDELKNLREAEQQKLVNKVKRNMEHDIEEKKVKIKDGKSRKQIHETLSGSQSLSSSQSISQEEKSVPLIQQQANDSDINTVMNKLMIKPLVMETPIGGVLNYAEVFVDSWKEEEKNKFMRDLCNYLIQHVREIYDAQVEMAINEKREILGKGIESKIGEKMRAKEEIEIRSDILLAEGQEILNQIEEKIIEEKKREVLQEMPTYRDYLNFKSGEKKAGDVLYAGKGQQNLAVEMWEKKYLNEIVPEEVARRAEIEIGQKVKEEINKRVKEELSKRDRDERKKLKDHKTKKAVDKWMQKPEGEKQTQEIVKAKMARVMLKSIQEMIYATNWDAGFLFGGFRVGGVTVRDAMGLPHTVPKHMAEMLDIIKNADEEYSKKKDIEIWRKKFNEVATVGIKAAEDKPFFGRGQAAQEFYESFKEAHSQVKKADKRNERAFDLKGEHKEMQKGKGIINTSKGKKNIQKEEKSTYYHKRSDYIGMTGPVDQSTKSKEPAKTTDTTTTQSWRKRSK